MSELILKTENLGIAFGGLKAVDNFNIQIGQKELVGLIGPNGAGKTTIFNLLTGVHSPSQGTFYIEGKSMNGQKTHQVVNRGVTRTFQNIRLFKALSVLDNVKVAFDQSLSYGFFSSILRTKKYWSQEAEIDAKAREFLAIFGLEDKADQAVCNLPYGQQRKLEIARALATGMKLLMLDEPAAGMNPTETADLLDCINTIKEKFNISILLIEHDMSLVMKICERIIVIDYGVTIAQGSPEQIAANPKVIAAYLGADEEGE